MQSLPSRKLTFVGRVAASVIAALMVVPVAVDAQMGGGGGRGPRAPRFVRADIRTTFDREAGATTVVLAPYGDAQVFAIGARYECPGEAPCRPGALQLLLVADAKHPAYAGLDTVAFVLPNRAPMRFAPAYNVRNERGGVREALSWMIPEDEFRAVAAGPTVDVELGSFRARLSPPQLEALRSLVARMAPAQPE